jgi:hypothetical protein
MHQAAMEDIHPGRERIPESPAGWLITMNASRVGQTAHAFVERYERFVDGILSAYRDAHRGALDVAGRRRSPIDPVEGAGRLG